MVLRRVGQPVAWLALLALSWEVRAMPQEVFPGEAWQVASPASQGLDPGRLTTAVEYLREHSGPDGVGELLIVRHGYVVWEGERVDRVHGVWSLTKSFTSTVLGLLIEDGRCRLDSRAAEWAPELAATYGTATLQHFTTMTSGYRAAGDEPVGSYAHGPSRTWFTPSPEPLFAPGERYAYWDSAMNEFGWVLTRIAGEPLDALFRRRVAEPIQMAAPGWRWPAFTVAGQRVVGGSGNGGKHLEVCARELARFGWLFLNQGRWSGRQVVSADWVAAATRPQVPADLPLGHPSSADGRGVYGYNWWTNGVGAEGRRKWPGLPATTFSASGFNNNDLFVIPDWRMVVVRLGLDEGAHRITDAEYDEFLRRVGEARTE